MKLVKIGLGGTLDYPIGEVKGMVPSEAPEFVLRYVKRCTGFTDKKAAFLVMMADRLLEYIDETEHQEGSECWDHFLTTKDTCDDFALYSTHAYDKEQL